MDLENYALGAELAKKGDFHIANISMLIAEDNMIEGEDFLKFGTITLINMDSPWLPVYIKKVIREQELTDLTGLFPLSYVESELSEEMELSEDEIILDEDGVEGVQKIPTKCYFSKIEKLCKQVTVAKKKFVRIEDKTLLNAFTNSSARAIMNTSDFPECSNDVAGFMPLTKDKVLAWY